MAGISKPNIPTFLAVEADFTSRNAEYPGSPFTDEDGEGTYALPYLGCNRTGSNAPGIGIATGEVMGTADRAAAWTLADQAEADRKGQDSAQIGNVGFVDRSSTDWPSSGGASGVAADPIFLVDDTGEDYNDPVYFVEADAAVADGGTMETTDGAVNETGGSVAIGDYVWGPVAAV